MRIAAVLLVVAVGVYLLVRVLQRRLGGPADTTATNPDRAPWHDPRAEEAYRRAVRERAERQRRGEPEPAPVPPPPPPSLVEIDDEVFGQDPYGRGDHEAFVVVSRAPAVDVVRAVDLASERFMLVDETGREHPDADALEAAFDAHDGEDDLYTPNYVAPARVTAAGVEGYVDCKGGIEPAMGHTFRRVLREELSRLGVAVRVEVRRDFRG